MSANNLLLWMSARQQGSWQQFRAAVEELHVTASGVESGEEDDSPDRFALPLYRTLRFNLQRMGHAEFFAGADGSDWRATPPTLAVTRSSTDWLGIVVGARSTTLLQRIFAAIGSANQQTRAFPAYPDQILIRADDPDAVAAVAERAGLLLQYDAPAALLACLPRVDDACVRHRTPMPTGTGWTIDSFSPENLAWRSATLEEANSVSGGLFRFALRHQRLVLYCSHGVASRIPGQVGKYLMLRMRRRQVLHYDAERRSLSLPASCRPPFLVERALILCSGSPPSYEGDRRSGILSYSEIPDRIAAIAAGLLRQEP